jgi:thiamine biosynthesis lipoprotein
MRSKNAKPLIALALTGAGSALVVAFHVPDAPVIGSSLDTTHAVALAAAPTATAAAPTPTATTTTGGTSSSGATATSKSTTTSKASGTPNATATPEATATPAPTATATSSSLYADGTYTGAAEQEPWGTFQVAVTISGGQITDVSIVSDPSDGHSNRINSIAVPILTQSVISAQSTNVDLVSGGDVDKRVLPDLAAGCARPGRSSERKLAMAHLVAPVMGTTVSIAVRDPSVDPAVLDRALAVLIELEDRFTTYRSESEVSRIDRNELAIADAHPDVHEVLAACCVLRAESAGAFNAWRDGHLDPSGYVKGWAAERAADVLRAEGIRDFAINVGGDIVASGERAPGEPWRVGLRHPDDPARVALVLGIRDGAVATSGLYERGAHITDARDGQVPAAWLSMTVVAPDLATADSVATAALAMGEPGAAWAATRPGCGVAAIDREGRLWTSPSVEALRLN